MSVNYDTRRRSWEFTIDLPKARDGKRRQMRRRGFKTEKLAERAEREARTQFGNVDLAEDGTVAAELVEWLQERELDVAVTTLANYRNAVMKYIIPHLGNRQLYTLDRRVIHDLYRTLLRSGGRRGQPLARETVRHVHRTLSKALKDLGVDIPDIRAPRPEDKEERGRKGVWTSRQCATFLNHVASDRLYAAWVLVVVCGMRRGEIAGLKWPKIDRDIGVIHVHWQRAVASGEVKGGVVEKEPKGKSKRSIAFGPGLSAVLDQHETLQRGEKVAAGVAYHALNYVFCKEDGTPYHPKYFTDRFRDLCVAAGVPVIVLHDGRHSSATVGADHGVPRHAMQRRLGHAHSKTMDDVYIHVLPEAERRAALIMEDVILKAS
ncbi:tyrosine-type recombinase/integrase [Micromonospora carbonacea]|uniref:site-specific integrase n=1 Tax=Micromonospora carbonacea TaxID=47853 RepID=UPI003D7346D0